MSKGYCFPCMFDYTDSEMAKLQSEMRKLYEEIGELEEAILVAGEEELFATEKNQKRFDVLVEVVDCMHVCESVLRILDADNDELSAFQEYVKLKNELRGYYD